MNIIELRAQISKLDERLALIDAAISAIEKHTSSEDDDSAHLAELKEEKETLSERLSYLHHQVALYASQY